MRILIAPDKFAGTLSAVQAADAIAAGWRRCAPDDELDLAPMADGGPGFLATLSEALGGELVMSGAGDQGTTTPMTYLLVGETAYIEAAVACGLDQASGDPLARTSFGVGELMRAAVSSGARHLVVGVGGTAVTDGGAGMLAALGATADVELRGGPLPLKHLRTIDLAPVRELLDGVELTLAADVDNPLAGLFGAAKTYGPQKGIGEDQIPAVDGALEAYAAVVDRRTALDAGAGAGGGIGYALLCLGATHESGLGFVADLTDLARRAGRADVVVTGEGAFDFSSRSGKVPYGVAEIAQAALRPCVAVAGRVLVGAREMRALGVESAYSLVDMVGEERALDQPAEALADVAERVARSWSR